MDHVPYHPLLIVTSEDLKNIRDFYGINDIKKINESLDAVEEWCKKQDHLIEAHKYLNRNVLERIFLLSRGSPEGTKNKIDRLFTSRGMMPDLCMNLTINEFGNLWDIVNYVPLPKLCPSDQSRVMVTQFLTENLEKMSLLKYMRYCLLIGQYRLYYDYCLSERYILDFKYFHIGHLSKLNPVVLKKAEVLCVEGFGTKIKGIHILNAPPFIDKVIFILKQGLREKVANRIHVHQSFEDLCKHVPKEILPKDYGGDEPSCSELAANWKACLKTEEAIKIIDESNNFVTDESKRSSAKFNEEYLGMPGSFRKLDVD